MLANIANYSIPSLLSFVSLALVLTLIFLILAAKLSDSFPT